MTGVINGAQADLVIPATVVMVSVLGVLVATFALDVVRHVRWRRALARSRS